MSPFQAQITDTLMMLHPYNISVMQSPLGDQWVRLHSYSCISWTGEKTTAQDFKADELWQALGQCHNEEDVSNLVWYSMPKDLKEIRTVPIELDRGRVIMVTVAPPVTMICGEDGISYQEEQPT